MQTLAVKTIWFPGFVTPTIMNEGSFRHMNQFLDELAIRSAQCKRKGGGVGLSAYHLKSKLFHANDI